MSQYIIDLLAQEYGFDQDICAVLAKTSRGMNRLERRLYFDQIKPRERELKVFLTGCYGLLDEAGRQQWMGSTVDSMLDQGGEPDQVDSLVMDVLGRINVYQALRQGSEAKGKPLKIMASTGSLGFVLVIFVIISAIIIFVLKQ